MRRSIMEVIERDRDKSASAITNDIGDDIDHATEERYRELYQLLCERDQKKLGEIGRALERIASKEYGICRECGGKIAKKRLVALPFTQMCINCKNEEERTISKSLDSYSSGKEVP